MVKDINQSKDSYPAAESPVYYNYNRYPGFTIMDDIAYFSADDGIHGKELWRTDGTSAGTHLVVDGYEGTASGSPIYLTVCNHKLYFRGQTADGPALFVSNGTPGNVTLLKKGIDPYQFTPVNDLLYFVSQGQLWKTDGTATGTRMVIDFWIKYQGWIDRIFSAKGKVFVAGQGYSPDKGYTIPGIWISNGTEASTTLLTNEAGNPLHFIEGSGDILYYTSVNDSQRRILRSMDVTNGTVTNISMPADVSISELVPFIKLGNAYYLAGNNSSSAGLYKFTPGQGITLLTTLISSTDQYTGICKMSGGGSKFFFNVLDPKETKKNVNQLWVSDGTASGTRLLMDGTTIFTMETIDDQAYFSGADNLHGQELWKSDGTPQGTRLLKDIFNGIRSSYAGNQSTFTKLRTKILFGAGDESGNELWSTDGSTQGTVLLKDINQTSTGSSSLIDLRATHDTLFFGVYATNDYQIHGWRSDGTANGTDTIADFVMGYIFNGAGYVQLNDRLYTYGSDLSQGKYGILQVDRKSLSVLLVKQFTNEYINWMQSSGSLIYFSTINNKGDSNYFWRTDGTSAGTILLNSSNDNLTVTGRSSSAQLSGNKTYFIRQREQDYLTELWVSDGSKAGTKLLKTVNTGAGSFNPYLVPFGDKIYFTSRAGNSKQLWSTDGSENGTKLFITDLSNVENLKVANGRLYFSASNGKDGTELWVSDGTLQNTMMLKDISPGASSSNPNTFMACRDKLLFFANDVTHGNELWKTDGTMEGTVLVKDISTGSMSTYPPASTPFVTGPLVYQGKVWFILPDGLWVSNGTDTGTHMVTDPGLAGVTLTGKMAIDGKKIWLSGQTYQYGEELYVGEVGLTPLSVYTFTGAGLASNENNWQEGEVPPYEIPKGVEIIIKPANNSTCIINTPFFIKGGKLTIAPGAKVIVNGNLQIN